MAEDDRPFDSDLCAEPRDVVRERRYVVAVGRRAGERGDGVRALEVVELRREERVVAAPARNEDQLEPAAVQESESARLSKACGRDAVRGEQRARRRKGGPCRDRTCDLGIKSPLLYQLS